MRKHLVTLLYCAAGLSSLLPGCAKDIEPPEPIPAAAPVPLNAFVRSWAQALDLPAGDDVKAVHVRDNYVFAYTRSGQAIAMARDTGRLQWIAQIRKTDRGGMHPPVLLENRVVIPTSSTLEVFEMTEGALIRSVPLKGIAVRSDAVGMGNLVFLGADYAGSGRVVALDITKEYVPTVWHLMIPKGGLASTPALFEEVLYIGGGDGNAYAVAADNREPLWPLKDGAFKTEGPIVADVAVDETGVYVASTDSRMYVLNRGSGRLRWQYYGGRPLTEGPVLTPTTVYLTVPGAGIAAFSKDEGEFNRKPLWLAAGMNQFLSEDERFAYLRRASDNAIVALDKKTGQQMFENNRRDLSDFATNTKGDGVIYAASKTNRVLAIKPVLRPGVVGEMVWNEHDASGDAALAAAAR
jgi:outer membrane protein assembly factor BamB